MRMKKKIFLKDHWRHSGRSEKRFRNSVRPIQPRRPQFWQNWNSEIPKTILPKTRVRRSRSRSTFTCRRFVSENQFRNFRTIESSFAVRTRKFRHPATFGRLTERWRTEFLFSSRSSVCPTFRFSVSPKSICRSNRQLMKVDALKIKILLLV